MKSKLAWTALVLTLSILVITTTARSDSSSPQKFQGMINDFSPPDTTPAGPYLVSGPWSLKVHANGKAEFDGSLNMVRSDDIGNRNFHTHHVQVADGLVVSQTANSMVIRGEAVLTSNGNPVFPGTIVRIELSGGSEMAFTNVKLVFESGASAHFTMEPYDGVVEIP